MHVRLEALLSGKFYDDVSGKRLDAEYFRSMGEYFRIMGVYTKDPLEE